MKQTSETTFEPAWLALREPADRAARDADLLTHAAALVAPGAKVLDLGSGTGATARAFAAAGFGGLSWRFIDHDATVLQLAQTRHPDAECRVGDLSQIAELPLEGVGLITASALFDLMPETWVAALMVQAAAAGVPVYAALNYDGKMRWSPSEERDVAVTEAFNRHQRGDKGLGPALGPAAADVCAQLAARQGWAVHTADSPWRLGPDAAALHGALITGIADAAHAAGAAEATGWGRDRRAALARSHAEIGHTDLLVIPK